MATSGSELNLGLRPKNSQTGNLESTKRLYVDVLSGLQTVLLWTPQQQDRRFFPGALSRGAFGRPTNSAKNAISLSFTLRRAEVEGNVVAEPSPLETGEIAEASMMAPTLHTLTFVFPLNPSKMQTTKDKVRQWVLTNGGFVLQTWGNDTIKMSLSGKTSNLSPELEGGSSFLSGIYETRAYKNFKLLEYYCDYFNGGNESNRQIRLGAPARTVLRLGEWGGSYEGIVSQFQFTVDAANPFRIEYTFNFEAVPKLHVPVDPGVGLLGQLFGEE